jgi:hypothetical protein
LASLEHVIVNAGTVQSLSATSYDAISAAAGNATILSPASNATAIPAKVLSTGRTAQGTGTRTSAGNSKAEASCSSPKVGPTSGFG